MPDVERQRLLTSGRVPRTKILLDRVKLGAGVKIDLGVSAGDLVWFQMLEGEAQLTYGPARIGLGSNHIVFLPAEFAGTLTTKAGAVLLYAQLPNVERFDPDFSQHPPQFRVIDWTREPVLDSEHDARKAHLCRDAEAFRHEGDQGRDDHLSARDRSSQPPSRRRRAFHVRAPGPRYRVREREADQRCTRAISSTTTTASGTTCERRQEDMVFVEFFVPGMYTTV